MQSAHRGTRMTALRRALAVAGLSLAGVFAGATAAQALGDATDPLTEAVATSVVEPVTEVVEPVTEVVEPVTEVVEPVTEVVEPVTAQVSETVAPVLTAVEPVAEVVEPVAEVVEPVAEIVAPVTKAVEPVTTPVTTVVAPIKDVVSPVTEALDPVVEPAPQEPTPDAPARSAPAASTDVDVNPPKATPVAVDADADEPQLSGPAQKTQRPEGDTATIPGLPLAAAPVPGDQTVETVSVGETSPPGPQVALSAATSSASAGGAGSRGAVDLWCQSAPWTPSLALTGLVSGAQLCPPRAPYRDIPTSPA